MRSGEHTGSHIALDIFMSHSYEVPADFIRQTLADGGIGVTSAMSKNLCLGKCTLATIGPTV